MYAFWIDGRKGPEFQILGDNALTDWDRIHGVAPPVLINPIFEELTFAQLKCIYACPSHSAIPKAKKQSD